VLAPGHAVEVRSKSIASKLKVQLDLGRPSGEEDFPASGEPESPAIEWGKTRQPPRARHIGLRRTATLQSRCREADPGADERGKKRWFLPRRQDCHLI
jgi:hypothetical protein